MVIRNKVILCPHTKVSIASFFVSLSLDLVFYQTSRTLPYAEYNAQSAGQFTNATQPTLRPTVIPINTARQPGQATNSQTPLQHSVLYNGTF